MKNEELRDYFSPLLDGELTGKERAEVEKRLAHDAEILRELDRCQRVDTLYRMLPRHIAPEELEERVRKAIAPRRMIGFPMRLRRRPLWPLVAAAAVFLVVVGAAVLQFSVLSRPPETYQIAAEAAGEPEAGGVELYSLQRARATLPLAERRETMAGDALSAESVNGDVPSPAPVPTEAMSLRTSEELGIQAEAESVSRSLAQRVAPAEQPQAPAAAPVSLSISPRAKTVDKIVESEARGQYVSLIRIVDGKRFELRNNIWHQQGYKAQETVSLKRDSQELQECLANDPSLTEVLKWKEAVIFQVAGVWYHLEPIP